MATVRGAAESVPALEPAPFAALDDHALMAAVRDGSTEAFETFYARHKPGVLSFCRHILGNREDAEDAVQHTFLATYRHVQREGPPAHPSAWLYKVARNRCLSMIRGRHESPDDTIEPATAGLAEEVEWRFELRELLRDLSRLPEDQRAALILFELGGLTQTEIGEALESSPDKVKALVYQARHGLMDRATARETECRVIRRRLATLRGGKLNDRTLKHHLDSCAGCRAFRADLTLQRRGLALVLPVVPLVDFHARLFALLGIGAGGAAAGTGAASTSTSAPAAAGHGSHLGAHAAGAKVVGAGVAATAVASAAVALALTLGGHHTPRVADRTTAAPVVPPAATPRPTAAAPRHRAAAPRHKKPRHSVVRAKASWSPRAVAVAPPPPARAPVHAAPPPAANRPPPRQSPVAKPKAPPKAPKHHAPTPPAAPPPQPAPTVPAPPAAPPTGQTTPTPVPPGPPAVPPPPGDQGGGPHGHPNGPPGPVGNPNHPPAP